MGKYYLGVDVGSSKTHALLVDQAGNVAGFGRGGPGNHESVGYDGFMDSVRTAIQECLQNSGLGLDQISGAGFGISGYDWQSEYPIFMDLLKGLNLSCPYEVVNDTCLGYAGRIAGGLGNRGRCRYRLQLLGLDQRTAKDWPCHGVGFLDGRRRRSQ